MSLQLAQPPQNITLTSPASKMALGLSHNPQNIPLYDLAATNVPPASPAATNYHSN